MKFIKKKEWGTNLKRLRKHLENNNFRYWRLQRRSLLFGQNNNIYNNNCWRCLISFSAQDNDKGHCFIGFLKTTSGLRTGRGKRRSILRARFGSCNSDPTGVSAIVCQFPVLLGRLPGVCVAVAAAAAAAATLSAGSGVWWQWAQCRQTVHAPNFLASNALNFSAGPNFIPIGPVKCSSDNKGSDAPSIRFSRKFWNRKQFFVFNSVCFISFLLYILQKAEFTL